MITCQRPPWNVRPSSSTPAAVRCFGASAWQRNPRAGVVDAPLSGMGYGHAHFVSSVSRQGECGWVGRQAALVRSA